MDLVCCGKRAAPRPSLFHKDRKLGLNIDESSEAESADGHKDDQAKSVDQKEDVDVPPAAPRFSRVERNQRPHQESADAASSGEDEDMDLSPLDRLAHNFKRSMALGKVGEKLKAKHNQMLLRKGASNGQSRSHDTESGSANGAFDPFLVNGDNQSLETEEALLVRLKQIAVQLRGEIRVRRQPERSDRERYVSFMPTETPETLHLELIPQMDGHGLQPWIDGELTLWESEQAFNDQLKPVVAVRLLRISKVKHLTKNSGCSVRLRILHPDSKETCEDILVHGSLEKAKACSEGLTECINIVRVASGRRTSVNNTNGAPLATSSR